MVSLENRTTYLQRINENIKLTAFYNFLLQKQIVYSSDTSINESDEIFLKIISSIQSNNKAGFEEVYNIKSKSSPSRDSPLPFVNDDFLLFCLIIGVVKFDIDKTWIKGIVALRTRNTITISLENILNVNYLSTNNLPEVVLIYLNLVNQEQISNDFLNNTYQSIIKNTVLFENKSDFQTLCALKAYDLIIELKESPKGSEVYLLKKFNENFIKRVRFLSWIIQITVLASLIYLLLNLSQYSSQTVTFIDKYSYVFTILGAVGFTFLGNQIPFIKKKTPELIMRVLGYPQDLIKSKTK